MTETHTHQAFFANLRDRPGSMVATSEWRDPNQGYVERCSEIIQKLDGSSIVVIDHIDKSGMKRYRKPVLESMHELAADFTTPNKHSAMPRLRNSYPLQAAKLLRLRK